MISNTSLLKTLPTPAMSEYLLYLLEMGALVALPSQDRKHIYPHSLFQNLLIMVPCLQLLCLKTLMP